MELDFDELQKGFAKYGYIINDEELGVIYLALRLEKPLLVYGPPGVGKTELGKVISKITQAKLIRLQCHEGLDESNALYDWNIQRQLVKIQLAARDHQPRVEALFSLANILQRPLLQAITSKERAVLLIDEIDRSDRSFEAFLLEILSDYQVSIPEIGTIKASRKPIVIITNNGERDLSEAMRRRCVFLYLDFPKIEQEASILRIHAPEVLEKIKEDLDLSIAQVRDSGHSLGPGGMDTFDWARSLLLLNADSYEKNYFETTLAALVKKKENLAAFRNRLDGQSSSQDGAG